MFSDSPRPLYSHAQKRFANSGFTLIELLMVIAVILVLSGITFGISRGVQNAQARAQAKAELATLSQAIEQFKLRYGDYPWHDLDDGDYPQAPNVEPPSTMLLYALTGRLSMEPEKQSDGSTKLVVSLVHDDLDNVNVKNRPKFIDMTKFSVQVAGTVDSAKDVALLDPWGNPYVYWYKWENTPNNWNVFGPHLYSTGPNGDSANVALKTKIDSSTGVMDDDYRDIANAEGIIFAGE